MNQRFASFLDRWYVLGFLAVVALLSLREVMKTGDAVSLSGIAVIAGSAALLALGGVLGARTRRSRLRDAISSHDWYEVRVSRGAAQEIALLDGFAPAEAGSFVAVLAEDALELWAKPAKPTYRVPWTELHAWERLYVPRPAPALQLGKGDRTLVISLDREWGGLLGASSRMAERFGAAVAAAAGQRVHA